VLPRGQEPYEQGDKEKKKKDSQRGGTTLRKISIRESRSNDKQSERSLKVPGTEKEKQVRRRICAKGGRYPGKRKFTNSSRIGNRSKSKEFLDSQRGRRKKVH